MYRKIKTSCTLFYHNDVMEIFADLKKIISSNLNYILGETSVSLFLAKTFSRRNTVDNNGKP